jgi:predicted Fe-Mo cluster-binding NifX family protein
MDVLITGGCGAGFIQRLAAQGVQVIATAATDPVEAVSAVLAGRPLPPPIPHEH